MIGCDPLLRRERTREALRTRERQFDGAPLARLRDCGDEPALRSGDLVGHRPPCAGGAFTIQQRDRILAALVRDVPALAMVEMTPEITSDARTLLLRHPLRVGDAIQLASCLYLQRRLARPVPFVAFDERLIKAAREEGLTVVTPRGRPSSTPARQDRSGTP